MYPEVAPLLPRKYAEDAVPQAVWPLLPVEIRLLLHRLPPGCSIEQSALRLQKSLLVSAAADDLSLTLSLSLLELSLGISCISQLY